MNANTFRTLEFDTIRALLLSYAGSPVGKARLAALLAMLNSCASGVAVVNIDNGFGAGYLAAQILRKSPPRP